jgi:sugar phosphate isomerase/epimerase
MKSTFIHRRQFLQTTAMAAAAATLPAVAFPAEKGNGVHWPIGCFNRPWTKFKLTYVDALDAIKAAGYNLSGLLTPTRGIDPLTGADATPEYLDAIKKKIAAIGVRANMAALRVLTKGDLAASIADLRKQIDNAHTLGLEFLLTFGVGNPAEYPTYYRVMADAAAYGKERGLKVVLKPHGGGSGASEEILRCMKEVNHPNFKVWYDAGNIIYYTGKDPIAELEPIVQHVTGFCAKDCAGQKSEVMVQFGTGKVDFVGVFRKLKAAGFNGPVMVECCEIGATVEETTASARKNREFLEKAFAQV